MWPYLWVFSNRSDNFGCWVSSEMNWLILIWPGIAQNKDLHSEVSEFESRCRSYERSKIRLSSSSFVLLVHIHPPNHVKRWIWNGVDASLLAHHHMCLLLCPFSSPSFVIYLPLKCRCLIDENDHIKLTIMCTMPRVMVRALKCKKVTSWMLSFSLHEHISPITH